MEEKNRWNHDLPGSTGSCLYFVCVCVCDIMWYVVWYMYDVCGGSGKCGMCGVCVVCGVVCVRCVSIMWCLSIMWCVFVVRGV